MNLNFTKLSLRFMLVAILAMVNVALYAQGSVSGTVVDNTGAPIFSATVVVDGTANGTTTDVHGGFTLNAAEGSPVTVFYVGYTEVKTALAQGMTVTLESDTTEIEQLVVVGYGAVKKETLTGSIAVVGDEMLSEKGAMASPLEALQGQVAGVNISRSSSAPGSEAWDINLRGSTSLNSSEPLVVIDGFVSSTTSELRYMNPSDIESISFLKDGAAAIYGSSAAAGVILVTTKQGASGKMKVEYNSSVTYKYLGNFPELMSLSQWADATRTALDSAAITAGTSNDFWRMYFDMAQMYPGGYFVNDAATSPFYSGLSAVPDFTFFDDVNFYDSLWGSAWSTDQSLSISGGNARATYRLSFGYMYNGSPLQLGNNSSQRYNIRANNTYKITDKLKWTSVISYDKEFIVTPTQIASALTTTLIQPGMPMTSVDGKPYAWGSGASNVSPYGRLVEGGDSETQRNKVVVNQSLIYDIAKWLKATVTGGYSTTNAAATAVSNTIDYYDYSGTRWQQQNPTQANTYYTMTTATTDRYSTSAYINANHTFKDKHDVAATMGAQYEFRDYIGYGLSVKDIMESLEIVNGSGDITMSGVGRNQYATLSYFGRFNYAYDSRYLFEVNGRYDGSSKFMPDNRWALFGGASAAWRLSKEKFMSDISWLNELKLRASYAQMGTQAGIGNYDGIQLYNLYSATGAYVGDELLSYISTNGSFASQTRQWERIKTTNLGVDFAVLKNTLSGSFDVYRKNNDNMLISVNLPSTLGDTAPSANAGRFVAQGWEGELKYRNKIGNGDFKYNLGATVSYQENELVEFDGALPIAQGYYSNRVGYGMSSLFGFVCLGKFDTDEQAAEYVAKYRGTSNCSMPTVLRAGDNIFEDVNGDGKIDAEDLVYLGSDVAPYSFSFNLGCSYKGLDLNATFQGTVGRVVWNSLTSFSVPTRALYQGSTTASIGNVWTPSNTDAYYSPYTTHSAINTYNYQASSLTAQDASYLRLKSLSLGYTIPAHRLAKTFFSGIRVYVAGNDLWEVSGMEDGYDPEASRSATGVNRYPFMRSVSAGANLTF